MVAAAGNATQLTTNEPALTVVTVGGDEFAPPVTRGVTRMIELAVTLTLLMVVLEDEHAADPYQPRFAPDPDALSPAIGATL
jgi:hypothetical protein